MSLSKGPLGVIFGKEGLSFCWNARALTSFPGLYIAVNTFGLWTDSSKGRTEILEQGEGHFKIKLIFRDLPVSQTWSFRSQGEFSTEWTVDMDVEEWLHIDEFRFGMIPRQGYKSCVCDWQQFDFPRPDAYERDIHLGAEPVSLIGARFNTSSEPVPSITMEMTDRLFLPFMRFSSLQGNSCVIGFRCVCGQKEKEYNAGPCPLFKSTIRVYPQEQSLDTRVERLRQDFLMNFRQEADKERLCRDN